MIDPFTNYSLFNSKFPLEVLLLRDRHKEALAEADIVDPIVGSRKVFSRELQIAMKLVAIPPQSDPPTASDIKAAERASKVQSFLKLAKHITDGENNLPYLVSITKQMASYENRGLAGVDRPLPNEILTTPYIGAMTGIGDTYLRLFTEMTTEFDAIRLNKSSRTDVENGVRFVKDTLLELLSFSHPNDGIYSKTYLIPKLEYSQELVDATVKTSETLDAVRSLLTAAELPDADYVSIHTHLLMTIKEDEHLDHLNQLCSHTVDSEVKMIAESVEELDAMAYALEITAMISDPVGMGAIKHKGAPDLQAIMDRTMKEYYARFDTVLPVEDDPGPPYSGGVDDDDCPCC